MDYNMTQVEGMLINVTDYVAPLGKIHMAADEEGLVGLWFEGQKHFASALSRLEMLGKVEVADSSQFLLVQEENPILRMTKEWLDIYFAGAEPDFLPPIHLVGPELGGTEFRKTVWRLLLEISYGETVTYGEIATRLSCGNNAAKETLDGTNGSVVDRNHLNGNENFNANSPEFPCTKSIKKMSAQAVGGAVGHNPISIIIPCHRVIGANGNLTGYAGGIEKKIQLLELERADISKLHLPRKKFSNL